MKNEQINKQTMSEKVKENGEYIIKRMSSGTGRGASITQMLDIIAKELGVSNSSVRMQWYGTKYDKGLRHIKNEMDTTDGSVVEPVRDMRKTKSNPSDSTKIFTLGKTINDNVTKLQELYKLQGEELALRLQEGFKKLEDANAQIIQVLVNQNQQVKTSKKIEHPKYNVDVHGNVKLIGDLVESSDDTQDEKINTLIHELDQKENEIVRLNKLLEERRIESANLSATLKRKQESLLGEKNVSDSLLNKIDQLKLEQINYIDHMEEANNSVVEAKRELANVNNTNIDLQKLNTKLTGMVVQLEKKENTLQNQLNDVQKELADDRSKSLMSKLFGSKKNVAAN